MRLTICISVRYINSSDWVSLPVMRVVIRDFELDLLPDKSVYWPAEKILMIADLHLGKINHFRRSGYPVPAIANDANTASLIELLQRHKPERMIFLGDLFHSHYNQEWEVLGQVVKHFPFVSFELVMGNHDIMSSLQYDRHRLVVHKDGLNINGLRLTHIPEETCDPKLYNLSGHIHPGARLFGRGKQALLLPCFYFGERLGILPAFGSFTGLHPVKPKRNDRVFVIAQDSVIDVTEKQNS
jgi:DNA ligase-associated metallophosphoesterase